MQKFVKDTINMLSKELSAKFDDFQGLYLYGSYVQVFIMAMMISSLWQSLKSKTKPSARLFGLLWANRNRA